MEATLMLLPMVAPFSPFRRKQQRDLFYWQPQVLLCTEYFLFACPDAFSPFTCPGPWEANLWEWHQWILLSFIFSWPWSRGKALARAARVEWEEGDTSYSPSFLPAVWPGDCPHPSAKGLLSCQVVLSELLLPVGFGNQFCPWALHVQ